LNRQIGAVNFTPLKPLFLATFQASRAYLSLNSSTPSIAIPLHRQERGLPFQAITPQAVIAKLQEAYGATTKGSFSQAVSLFTNIIHSIVFTVTNRRSELEEVSDSIFMFILNMKF
jgi:coatomer subunit alpha